MSECDEMAGAVQVTPTIETKCGCIDLMDKHLKPHNGRLPLTFTPTGRVYPTIMVEKIEKRGKRVPAVIPTFCPFCGIKYRADEAERAKARMG